MKILTEAEFISQVNLIAESHDCWVSFIEPAIRRIDIEGPPEKSIECAAALEEILGEYLTNEEVDGPETLFGWPV